MQYNILLYLPYFQYEDFEMSMKGGGKGVSLAAETPGYIL
jgi:hypothetical protein